ncbi:phosphatase PAP2 family protein [Streptomyces sp. t39]|uniref:phosphatase PAP2 family protein n=1 Tax=Streptomyces sp. t39 TaxID=1828156 RepID=UPI0021CA285D|nr:phosphatase PAP2 family protein [Streptomyces sp. t39]
MWRRPRVLLWTALGVVALAFLVALEIAARRYGVRGPISNQVREVLFAPKSGPLLYAGLALTTVVLSWRRRFVAFGAAIAADLVLWLVRWAVDAPMMAGTGALWVLLAHAVVAVTRRTGDERVLLLKAVGLGLLLVAGRKAGDTWLLITSKARPMVLDPYMAAADHALGSPSWLAGRIVGATGPVGAHVLDWVYVQLGVAAVVVALYQLRNAGIERRFPGHHLVRTFLVIGLLGPAVYMIFPVVGPIYAYGAEGGQWAVAHLWPDTPPPVVAPQPMPFDGITPRNCMPSLHTAWATAIFIHSRKGPRALRYAGTLWLITTLGATLGFGYHYGADIIAGVVFTLTIEAALRALDRGWDRRAVRLVAGGGAVFVAFLLAFRFLSMELAAHPWVFGPLLVLATLAVMYDYTRVTRQWDRETAAAHIPAQRHPSRTDSAAGASPSGSAPAGGSTTAPVPPRETAAADRAGPEPRELEAKAP